MTSFNSKSIYRFCLCSPNLTWLETSVIRCWSKKLPNCFQKLPKYCTAIFIHGYIQISTKVTNLVWATLIIKFVANNFQKSPNLVTLLATTEEDLVSAIRFEAEYALAWSSLEEGDEGCIGPNVELLCLPYSLLVHFCPTIFGALVLNPVTLCFVESNSLSCQNFLEMFWLILLLSCSMFCPNLTQNFCLSMLQISSRFLFLLWRLIHLRGASDFFQNGASQCTTQIEKDL